MPVKESRKVPGFPGYRVSIDREVWERLGPSGTQIDPSGASWERLRAFQVTSAGSFVRLRHGGREHVRSVDLLFRAAFADEPARWLGRIGPKPPRAKPPSPHQVESEPQAAELAAEGLNRDQVDGQVEREPSPAAAIAEVHRLGNAPRSAFPALVAPPGFVFVDSFPGYAIGPDRSIWKRVTNGWRPVKSFLRKKGTPRVHFSRNGKRFLRSVEKLHAEAFPPLPRQFLRPLSLRDVAGEPRTGSAHGRAKLDEAKVVEARPAAPCGMDF